jgi:hypothetical protein
MPEARYDVVVQEDAIVAELFFRYVEDGVSIAELARWLTSTRTARLAGRSTPKSYSVTEPLTSAVVIQ